MKAYDYLQKIEFFIAGILLTAVLGLTGWASVTRFLGIPNIWAIEVTQILFAWVCFLAASIAFRKSHHFNVDILSLALPEKFVPYLNLIKSLIVLAILITLIWISLDFVEQAHRRRLPLTGIRYSAVAAALPAACAMMAINCLISIVKDLRNPNNKMNEA